MGVRRVVTGHDESGKSVFASDQTVEPDRPALLPSSEFYQLWGGDTTPQFPDDGAAPDWRTYFPPVGGFRFGMLTIPPQTSAAEQDLGNVEDAVADIEAKLPGLLRYMDPSDPGMHATDTIDFEVVLEGTVVDTVVQNGTRHRWKNPGDKPARMAVFICGADHSAVPAAD